MRNPITREAGLGGLGLLDRRGTPCGVRKGDALLVLGLAQRKIQGATSATNAKRLLACGAKICIQTLSVEDYRATAQVDKRFTIKCHKVCINSLDEREEKTQAEPNLIFTQIK